MTRPSFPKTIFEFNKWFPVDDIPNINLSRPERRDKKYWESKYDRTLGVIYHPDSHIQFKD